MSRRDDGPLMSVSQAARRLGIGPTAAYEWARRGELPGCVRLGKRYHVRRALLEAFITGSDVLGDVAARSSADGRPTS